MTNYWSEPEFIGGVLSGEIHTYLPCQEKLSDLCYKNEDQWGKQIKFYTLTNLDVKSNIKEFISFTPVVD